MNFATLQGLTIPEGVVTQIADASGRVLWALSGGKVILEVEKITSDTYAGETTYTGEEFILLDIYPKTNGTVKVTYGGLTKTITDTSGAAEPNAQQVFFGTFNGVSDSVETPASGELTIDGDYYAFGCGPYHRDKYSIGSGVDIIEIVSLGVVEKIPTYAFATEISTNINYVKLTSIKIPASVVDIGENAFHKCFNLTEIIVDSGNEHYSSEEGILFNKNRTLLHSYPSAEGKFVIPSTVINIEAYACFYTKLTDITIPASVTSIGGSSFSGCSSTLKCVTVLATTPPTAGDVIFSAASAVASDFQIIVPKGCGETYKAADGWSEYAKYIVEAS